MVTSNHSPLTTHHSPNDFLRPREPHQRPAARLYPLYRLPWRRGRRADAYRSPVGPAPAADSPVAERLVDLSQCRAYALSTCFGRNAPGGPGGDASLSFAMRRMRPVAVAGVYRKLGASRGAPT